MFNFFLQNLYKFSNFIFLCLVFSYLLDFIKFVNWQAEEEEKVVRKEVSCSEAT